MVDTDKEKPVKTAQPKDVNAAMTGTITAIVPTYNRADYLAETLAALAAQTRPVEEIIVWDDGSTDETGDIAAAANGPIRYFRSENGGKSRALNAALAEARGDYIWICDDDDLAVPEAAAILAAPLDHDPALVVSGGAYRRFRTDTKTGERVETGPGYWPDLSQGSVLRHLLEDIFLFQNAMLVRRTAYEAVGPFREDLPRSIDYDMIIRLAARYPLAVSEDVVFLQRKHDGARGPAAARHAASQSDAVWKEADRMVFAPFRDALPITLYDAMYESDDPKAVRRVALLQRACVYARRTDFAIALEDLAAAAALLRDRGLSTTEHAICRRAVSGKHGCVEMLTVPMRRDLTALARRSEAGASIVRALLRGMRWRLKEAIQNRDLSMLARLARTMIHLHLAVGRRGVASPQPAQIERRALPSAAYEAVAVHSS